MNKFIMVLAIIIFSGLFISSCKDNEQNTPELSPIVVSTPHCDGQWVCYEKLGYAKCNGDLRNPSVPYEEVCN